MMTNKEKRLLFLLDLLAEKDDFVFLWNGREDQDNYRSYIFVSPVKCILAFEKHDLFSALLQLEECLRQGFYVAGFISYEAGFCFEDALTQSQKPHKSPIFSDVKFPLLWFGVYETPIVYDHRKGCFCNAFPLLKVKGDNADNFRHKLATCATRHKLATCATRHKLATCATIDLNRLLTRYEPQNPSSHPHTGVENVRSSIEKDDYIRDVLSIKSAIARGDTYQVNYTFKHIFDFSGNSRDLFFDLCMKQSASYAAFIRCMDKDILSLSPELFFRRQADEMIVKPMKGTIERGVDNSDDLCKAEELHNSIKNRAENVMIVDLLRNDLGRISKIGSVNVDRLYEVEKYETLFQMTSTIRSQLRDDVGWLELFKNIFPSGSVTGTPKIITMRIIDSLEKELRRIYTGSIGYIAPDNSSVFNVVIRTILLDRTKKQGEMGIGSGIVYDSDPESEFEECLLKADFLTCNELKRKT